MNSNTLQLMIAKVTHYCVTLAVGLVLLGGGIYLDQHGQEVFDYHKLAAVTLHPARFRLFSAMTLINTGLLVLVASQIVRLLLIGWLFIKQRDYFFCSVIVFILTVIGVSYIL